MVSHTATRISIYPPRLVRFFKSRSFVPSCLCRMAIVSRRLPQPMGKLRNSSVFYLLLLLCTCYGGAESDQYGGAENDQYGEAESGQQRRGLQGKGKGTGGFNPGGIGINPNAAPPPPSSPPPPSPLPPPQSPVQRMQLKQCVKTADGQVRSISIPVGTTLDDPRIQKRFERMFNSPMVLSGAPFRSTGEGQECVACSGGC